MRSRASGMRMGTELESWVPAPERLRETRRGAWRGRTKGSREKRSAVGAQWGFDAPMECRRACGLRASGLAADGDPGEGHDHVAADGNSEDTCGGEDAGEQAVDDLVADDGVFRAGDDAVVIDLAAGVDLRFDDDGAVFWGRDGAGCRRRSRGNEAQSWRRAARRWP